MVTPIGVGDRIFPVFDALACIVDDCRSVIDDIIIKGTRTAGNMQVQRYQVMGKFVPLFDGARSTGMPIFELDGNCVSITDVRFYDAP